MAKKENLETLQRARDMLMAQLLRHAENLCDNFHMAQTTGAVDGIITTQRAIDALDRAITSE
jgi:hypothetical protein